MKKTAGKSIFGYIFMFLVLALGVCCVLLAVLVLSPDTEIFGISYVNSNATNPIYRFEDDIVGDYQSTKNSITGINIKTNYFNVKFCNSKEVSSFKIQCEGKVNGLAKNAKNKKIDFKTSLSNGIFYIESVEPDINLGFNKSVDLCIYLPVSSSSNQYPISTKNVNIETDSGNIILDNNADDYNFNDLVIKTNKGTVSLGKTFNCVSGNLKLEANTGNITIYSNFKGLVDINVKEKARIKIDSMEGSLDVNSDFGEIKANKIGGELNYSSNGGYIEVGTVGTVNCNREKDSVASLHIGTVLGNVLISNAKSSAVEIGKVVGDALIHSTSGNITIKEIQRTVDIKTESGKINLTFNTSDTRTSNVTTTYGYICANFEMISNVNINQHNKGGIDINVKDNLSFFFNYFTNKGIKIYAETTDDKIKTGENVNLQFNNPTSSSPIININQDRNADGNYNGFIKLNNGFEIKK